MSRTLMYDDELRECGCETPRWRVVEPKPCDGHIKLFDREKHVEEFKLLSAINNEIVDGKLVLCRKNAPKLTAAAQDDPELDKAILRVMASMRFCEAIQKKHGISLAQAYLMAKTKTDPKDEIVNPFPSRSAIYRYAKAKRQDRPPLAGNANKGNRLPRYSSDISELVCRTANTLYLKPGSRWTLYDITKYVNDRARESGWLATGQKISQDYIRSQIYKNESIDPEIDRMDPKLLAAAKSIAKHRILAGVPFERVEQDAVHLPFVVKTPYGTASNIYLIHAIDCCTGVVVGWYILIGQPSESDGLKCVESILFPKINQLKSLGLTYDIDIHGTPHQLVFDNGPETRGERMRKLVRLDIDLMHCKSRHAHGKPYIERLNRSLKEALQTLPGCTRVNGKDGQRDPIELGDPLMTLEELELWVVRWYFESWGHTELKRHMRTDFHDVVKMGKTPIKRWKAMTEELAYAMPLSPPWSQWLMTLYEHDTKRLNRKTGITYAQLNYRGDNLAYLVKTHGEIDLKILIDPDDYRIIYVDEGNDLPLVPLTEEFVTNTTPGYSFSQIKALLNEQKLEQTESPTKTQFRKDVHERSLGAPSKVKGKKPSKAELNRSVADQAKVVKAVNRAIQKPINPPVRNGSSKEAQPGVIEFADAPALPLLSRIDNKEQP